MRKTPVTLGILSMIFGLLAASVLAVMGISHNRMLNWIARVYVSLMRGTPQIPEDLTQHDCLCYSYIAEPDEWHLIGSDGECVVKVNGPIVTSQRQVLNTAAVRGPTSRPIIPSGTSIPSSARASASAAKRSASTRSAGSCSVARDEASASSTR